MREINWWDSLEETAKKEMMAKYCPHWTDTIDVTDNDIFLMYESEKSRERDGNCLMNPNEWWDSLDKATRQELTDRYTIWEDSAHVTYNDIIVMHMALFPREEKTETERLTVENQQLREALQGLISYGESYHYWLSRYGNNTMTVQKQAYNQLILKQAQAKLLLNPPDKK